MANKIYALTTECHIDDWTDNGKTVTLYNGFYATMELAKEANHQRHDFYDIKEITVETEITNKEEWVYDIFLNENFVGYSGDLTFETKREAEADAYDYIISELEDEYNAVARDFEVRVHKRRAE